MKQDIPKLLKQYARIVSLVLFAWAAFGPVGGILARSHKVRNQPVIRVEVYNYAGVDRSELRRAEGRAAHLFGRVGIRIAWILYSQKQGVGQPQPEDPLADFFVRIVPAFMAARCRHERGALGQSLVPSGVRGPTPGGYANIFYKCVEDVSINSGSFVWEILGDAIAHELGHLLLGSGHSSSGIMKARWTLQDMAQANRGALRFSPGQVESIHRAARSLHNNPSLTVTARR